MNNRTKDILSPGRKISGAELYLILVLLVFGVSTSFLLPVSGGYDEETHLLRVWELSSFTFLPNEKLGAKMPFPAIYWEMSYRRPFIVRAVEPDFWSKYSGLPLDAHDYIYGSVETRSVYSPPLLLPQALVMRFFGRGERLPALSVFYACRLIGLLSYLLLAWLAVWLIPFGKWILAILATSPVAVLQASTISADAISNGIALLFIGGSLALVNKEEIRWKEWLLLVFLFLLLFLGKLNIIPLAILPFLLLRPSQFKIRYGYAGVWIAAILLLLVEVLGWNVLAYSRFYTALEGANPLGQIKFISSHPIEFLGTLASNLWTRTFGYLRDWIAIYGYAYWPVPALTYYLYGLALLAALFLKPQGETIEKRTRVALAITFVIGYLATLLSLYVTFTPVGSQQIEGVQGRYFLTVMPLLFLALAYLPLVQKIRVSRFLPFLAATASLLVFIAGMYLSYHVPCGSQFYQGGLCYQPNYKNWAPDASYSPPVNGKLTLAQEIVPECDGMTELRVWLNAGEADPAGRTHFTFADGNDGRALADLQVANSALPAGNWYSLHFPPEWSSTGRFYLLTIRGDLQDEGPRVAYSLRQEYPAGKLYENGQSIAKDLIFQTGCIAGFEKLRLTSSR